MKFCTEKLSWTLSLHQLRLSEYTHPVPKLGLFLMHFIGWDQFHSQNNYDRTSHFSLLGGTSSILRTFRAGPVLCSCVYHCPFLFPKEVTIFERFCCVLASHQFCLAQMLSTQSQGWAMDIVRPIICTMFCNFLKQR